jgi:hypothetical protein
MSNELPLFAQINYVKRLSSHLPRFTQKGPESFNCRCIACNDSAKSETKARGWFFEKSNNIFYFCHNCGISLPLGGFLKKFVPSLYQEYNLERFALNTTQKPKEDLSYMKTKTVLKSKWEQHINWKLPEHALKFLTDRKIPDVSIFGYTNDASSLAMDLFEFYGLDYTLSIPKIEGIVIPFVTVDGTCNFIQIRTFSKDKKWRYLTIGFDDSDVKLFGVNRLDRSKQVFVTEGPFDSCFISNAVATADSALERANIKLNDCDLVLVFDNEPRSPVIVSKITNAINKGYKVVIFPDYIQEKDLNDMILAGYDVQMLVDQNQYSGLNAKMKLAQWKKI